MIVDISDVLGFIKRKLKKFRMPNNGITMTEEQQVTTLLLKRFICRDRINDDASVSYTASRAFKMLAEDDELTSELIYYGELAGDMIMRYFDYIDDEVGYNCDVTFDIRRRILIIRGDDEWLRRTIAKFELI